MSKSSMLGMAAGAFMALAPGDGEASQPLDVIDWGAAPVASQDMEYVFTPDDLQCLRDHADKFVDDYVRDEDGIAQWIPKTEAAKEYVQERMKAVEGMNPVDAFHEFSETATQSYREFNDSVVVMGRSGLAYEESVGDYRVSFDEIRDVVLGDENTIAPIEAFYINQNFANQTVERFEQMYGLNSFVEKSGLGPTVNVNCEVDLNR